MDETFVKGSGTLCDFGCRQTSGTGFTRETEKRKLLANDAKLLELNWSVAWQEFGSM